MTKYHDDVSEEESLNEIYFTPEVKLIDREMIQLTDNLRLYFDSREKNGFDFCVVQFVSATTEDVWSDPEVRVERVCHGTAYFDGIRHFYVPYWYYVDIEELTKLTEALTKLVKQFCPNT